MTRPLLAVDVDGVVSLFGFDEPPDRSVARFERVNGVEHCISLPVGERLRRLGEHYDLVWASGWEANANAVLPPILDLPELPYLSFNGAARFGSAHWKVEPLERYADGRPVAWVDDSFDETCYEWARQRDAPTLLMPTESHLGLEEVHVEALVVWALGFD